MLHPKYTKAQGGEGTKLRVATLVHFTTQLPRCATGRLEKVKAYFHFIINSIKLYIFYLARRRIADDQ